MMTTERPGDVEKAWPKWLLWSAGFGLFVAFLPMLIALIGLAVASAYLQTFHWFLYFSIPAGLAIAIPSGIFALVLILRRRTKRNR